MKTPCPVAILSALLATVSLSYGQVADKPNVASAVITKTTNQWSSLKGQRVFSCGHSFHYFMPAVLDAVATAGGIQDHQTVGLSAIGGSSVAKHWLVPDDKNEAKAALTAGKVDVLTLAPMWLPDLGIDHFVNLARQHNPHVRVTIQEFWLPNDEYDPVYPVSFKIPVDHNACSGEELRSRHEPYFQAMDEKVRQLNQTANPPTVFVVPVGQAVLALREKVINGEVPEIKSQADLFSDRVGHPRAAIQLLEAYCHFAVIYRTSPVGLPLPGPGKNDQWLFDHGLWTLDVGKPILNRFKEPEKLNRLLQELAWDAVRKHSLSGVKE